VFTQLFGVKNFDWTGWCWRPMFNEVRADLEHMSRPNSSCGKFSSAKGEYWLSAFFRIKREAGGHQGLQQAGYPSLLYCEDQDCPHKLFFWPGPEPGVKGKPKVPHLCPNHDTDQKEAWRKRRERAMKRAKVQNADSLKTS
jgi:hypothetical protein